MDIKETFIAANSALTDLAVRVRPEHLTLEAPAYARFHDGQTLRDSLNIMAYENLCVPKVLAGETRLTTNPEFDGDLLGDELAGNYERLAAETLRAINAIATETGDLLRQMGIIPPEIAVSGDADPEDRFLAYIGRQPRDRSVLVG